MASQPKAPDYACTRHPGNPVSTRVHIHHYHLKSIIKKNLFITNLSSYLGQEIMTHYFGNSWAPAALFTKPPL